MVTKVDEPSKYGVVVHGADGKIAHFVEKPQTFVGLPMMEAVRVFWLIVPTPAADTGST